MSLIPTNQLPLYGKRILITAPRNYAARLASEILIQGGIPVLMPTIETCLLEHYDELDQLLQNISQFDWIAFTSRNGIDGLIERLELLNLSLSILHSCKLSAIGKDVERLQELGLNVDLIPSEPSPQGIIAQLAQFPNINKQNILVPIPKVIGIPEPNIIPNFITGLQQLGMTVIPVSVYQTRCLDKSLYTVELELIKQVKIDIIAFSSTAEIEAFLQMVNHTQIDNKVIMACFGPYTGNNAKKLGLKVDIISKDYGSFTGFVQAIADYLTHSNSFDLEVRKSLQNR